MKVRSAIKVLCPHCYMVRRGKHLYVYCKETPKHKQKQGFHTAINRSVSSFCQPATLPTSAVPSFNSSIARNVPTVASELFCSPCAIPRGAMNPASKFRAGGSAGVILG